MGFAPIRLSDYVRLHLLSNRGDKAHEVTALLKSALAAYKAGTRCQCGEPIWVIGSAFVGHMCFTCITGEADPSDDYEIAEACGGRPVRLSDALKRQAEAAKKQPQLVSMPPSAERPQPQAAPAPAEDPGFYDGITDKDVPF